jgi:hypothetical protein
MSPKRQALLEIAIAPSNLPLELSLCLIELRHIFDQIQDNFIKNNLGHGCAGVGRSSGKKLGCGARN